MSTTRLEAFSDGVFAIAATLLIFEVGVDESGRPLANALLQAWPSYTAYAISFLTIGIIWMNHHTVFSQIDRVDRTFLVINVFFLMFVAFIPFPTALLAEHLKGDGARAATITYGLNLTLTAISYSVLWFYASVGRRVLRADADPRTVAGITRSYLPGPWIYGAATLIAVASPSTSVVLFAAFALFYVVESSVFGRDRAV
ncbi:MAG: TMEM175 family protein [Actinomycetota bacterium]